jgi:hypothetical protein
VQGVQYGQTVQQVGRFQLVVESVQEFGNVAVHVWVVLLGVLDGF